MGVMILPLLHYNNDGEARFKLQIFIVYTYPVFFVNLFTQVGKATTEFFEAGFRKIKVYLLSCQRCFS